jgi:hypothetical protein
MDGARCAGSYRGNLELMGKVGVGHASMLTQSTAVAGDLPRGSYWQMTLSSSGT